MSPFVAWFIWGIGAVILIMANVGVGIAFNCGDVKKRTWLAILWLGMMWIFPVAVRVLLMVMTS